jgi:hypothetical protein
MRYRLRTLLIFLALGPPLLAGLHIIRLSAERWSALFTCVAMAISIVLYQWLDGQKQSS